MQHSMMHSLTLPLRMELAAVGRAINRVRQREKYAFWMSMAFVLMAAIIYVVRPEMSKDAFAILLLMGGYWFGKSQGNNGSRSGGEGSG